MNSNFALNPVVFSNLSTNNSSTIDGDPLPPILSSNALYGIIAMIALICMLFGFWCGKNCSSHFVSKLCGKWCAFCCGDHDDETVDEDADDSAWNWKHTQHKIRKRSKVRSRSVKKNTGKRKRGSKENKPAALTLDTNDEDGDEETEEESDDSDGDTYEENTSDEQEHEAAQHALLKEKQRNYGSNRHRLKWSMTPLSSRSLLPGQQNIEQSPDVRVAHFQSPHVNEIPHATSFDAFGFPATASGADSAQHVGAEEELEKMASVESDEEDAPPHSLNSTNIASSRSRSGSKGTEMSNNRKRKKFHDLEVDDNKRLKSSMQTKRVASVDSGHRKIIVLQSKSSRKRVVSPPPIHSKSEFKMMLRPVQSADVVALKKRNAK